MCLHFLIHKSTTSRLTYKDKQQNDVPWVLPPTKRVGSKDLKQFYKYSLYKYSLLDFVKLSSHTHRGPLQQTSTRWVTMYTALKQQYSNDQTSFWFLEKHMTLNVQIPPLTMMPSRWLGFAVRKVWRVCCEKERHGYTRTQIQIGAQNTRPVYSHKCENGHNGRGDEELRRQNQIHLEKHMQKKGTLHPVVSQPSNSVHPKPHDFNV